MQPAVTTLKDSNLLAAKALAKAALIIESDDPTLSSYLLRRAYGYLNRAIKQREREIAQIRSNITTFDKI